MTNLDQPDEHAMTGRYPHAIRAPRYQRCCAAAMVAGLLYVHGGISSAAAAPLKPLATAVTTPQQGYLVHVASGKSEDDALAAYRRLQKQYPSILGNRVALVVRTDLKEKGVYYRAVAGSASSQSEATRLCDALIVAGGDCVIIAPPETKSRVKTAWPTTRPASPGPRTSSGSGFFVSTDGWILTNDHVVAGCSSIYIHSDQKVVTARILGADSVNDLALLSTDLKPKRIAKWQLAIRQGEDVVVYGFPLSGVLATSGNVSSGLVTALAGVRDDARHIQISAALQPGNSGGSAVDRKGNVIGVIVSVINQITANSRAQNVGFAIKSSVALKFLQDHGVEPPLAENSVRETTLATPELVEHIRSYAVQVRCEH